MENKTSCVIINVLKSIFSRIGYPTEIRSDNSPFGSREFELFAENNNIVHVFSSPRYPQSNGLAEKAVAIAKNILKRCYEQDLVDEFAYRILEYNITPMSSMQVAPAVLFFGRQLKSRLPIVDKLLYRTGIDESVVQNKFKQKRNLPVLNVGDLIMFKKNGKDWCYGTIVSKFNKRSYIVRDNFNNEYRRNRRLITITKNNFINTSDMLYENYFKKFPYVNNYSQEASKKLNITVPPLENKITNSDDINLTHQADCSVTAPAVANYDENTEHDTLNQSQETRLSNNNEPLLATKTPDTRRSSRQIKKPNRYGEWTS